MDTIKAKVKTKTMTSAIEGPLDSVIVDLLCYVSDPQRRQGILRKLKALDERMSNPKVEAKS